MTVKTYNFGDQFFTLYHVSGTGVFALFLFASRVMIARGCKWHFTIGKGA